MGRYDFDADLINDVDFDSYPPAISVMNEALDES